MAPNKTKQRPRRRANQLAGDLRSPLSLLRLRLRSELDPPGGLGAPLLATRAGSPAWAIKRRGLSPGEGLSSTAKRAMAGGQSDEARGKQPVDSGCFLGLRPAHFSRLLNAPTIYVRPEEGGLPDDSDGRQRAAWL